MISVLKLNTLYHMIKNLISLLLLSFSLGGYSKLPTFKTSISPQEELVSLQEIKVHDDFEVVTSNPINLGLTQTFYWIKLETNDSLIPYDFVTIGEATTNKINFNYKSIKTKNWKTKKGGESISQSESNSINTTPSFSLLDVDWSEPVYIMIDARNENLTVPIHFYTTKNFYNTIIERTSIHNFLYGFLILIILLNSIWYIINRDLATAYFVLNMILFVLFISYIDGYLQQGIDSTRPSIYNFVYYTISFLGTVTAFLFGQYFLKTKEYAPKIHQLANIGLVIVTVGYLLSWFTGTLQLLAQLLILGNNILLTTVYLVGAIKARKSNYTPASFMLYAFILTAIFSNLFILQYFGIIPANLLTQNGIHIGYSILGISITIGLFLRYKLLIEKQKHRETLQRIELEKLVKIRTTKLEEMNAGLVESNKLILKQKEEINNLNYDLIEALKKLNDRIP